MAIAIHSDLCAQEPVLTASLCNQWLKSVVDLTWQHQVRAATVLWSLKKCGHVVGGLPSERGCSSRRVPSERIRNAGGAKGVRAQFKTAAPAVHIQFIWQDCLKAHHNAATYLHVSDVIAEWASLQCWEVASECCHLRAVAMLGVLKECS